jgi:hypothetical protein
MSRRVAAVSAAVAMLLVVSSPAALGRSNSPVLGWKHAFQGGTGFGTAKPRTVYLGVIRQARSSRSPGSTGAPRMRWDSVKDGARANRLQPATHVWPPFTSAG